MRKPFKSLAALLALLLAVGCTPPPTSTGNLSEGSGATPAPELGAGTAPNNIGATPLLQNLFYDEKLYAAGFSAPACYTVDGQLRAGMVPHHLLASDMIAGFFALAGEQHSSTPYDAVLLVSPSHFPENCGSDAVTALAGWATHTGEVQPARPLAQAILDNELLAAENNPQAVEADHGVAGLMPYLAKYLPEVPVTVCLLANKLPGNRLRAFQDLVAEQLSQQNLLVVASADCSHYLTPAEAAPRDEQTAKAILTGNRQEILGYSDKNVDSPQAVTTMLRVAQALDTLPVQLGHSASNHKLPLLPGSVAYNEGITTYFVFAVVE